MTFVFKLLRGSVGNYSRPRCRQRVLPPANLSPSRRSRNFCACFGNSNRRQLQARHSDQIISARHEVTPCLRSLQSPIAGSPQTTHRFHPAKDFLDAFAYPQTGLIAGTVRGALIHSRDVHAFLACRMGRNFPLPTALHENLLMVGLVRAHRLGLRADVQLRVLIQLPQGHDRLGFGDRIVQGEIGAQPVPVFHERVAAKVKLRLFALGFAIQDALGIGRALMRVVAALFTPEVHAGVARIIVLGRGHLLLIPAVLADKALQAGPGLDQRPIGSKMFITGPTFLARQLINFCEEQLGNLRREDALIVLGENAVIEAAFGKLAVQKPEPEQIVTKLFAEEPFAAHTVEGGEDTGLEQLLRRNAGAAFAGIECVEQRRELLQNRIDAAFDGAQRMVHRHTGVEINDGQKVRLGLRFSAHGSLTHPHRARSNILRVFQQPAREFFNKIIPPEQQKAADDTRIEMIKEVGLYKTIKQSGNLPNTVKEGKYARTLLMRSVVVQEINGGFDKAEASFFKINQKAAPISPTELQLIESRDKAYGIATRALVRAGVGHKYWKKFPPETQVQIENLAQETYSLLFKPPLSSPISVGLDLPIGGRGYSTEAISLLLALVNLTIYPPKKKSRGMKNVDGIKAPQIPDDKDGKETIVLLQDVKRIITRVAGKALRSLALHSAVYFYSASGRFQPSAFLAVASLIKELEDENGKPFLWFSIHRAHFESYLARHRFLVNQMVIKHGSMEKSHEPILAMIRAMLLLSSERKTDPEIMEGLKKQFDYLYPQEATDFPGTQSEFSTAVKNAKLRKAGLEKVHSCHICGAAIHPNAISMEHYVDKKHGGTSNLANAEFSHPYCNSEKDALQAIFKSSDPEAWSSVPTPKVLCQQPLPNPPEGSIQTESPAPV
jgi:hypothetical protein